MDISRLPELKRKMLCELSSCKHDIVYTCENRRIIDNFIIENRIIKRNYDKFSKSIENQAIRHNCINIRECISKAQIKFKSLMLEGPDVNLRWGDRIGTIKTTRRLSYLCERSPSDIIGIKPVWEDPAAVKPLSFINAKIKLKTFSIEEIIKPIKNDLGFIWATMINDVLRYIDNADEVRDLLGLDFVSIYGKMEYLVILEYSATKIIKIKIPTIIEGACLPPFKPSMNPDSGITTNLRSGNDGLKEFVHEGFNDPREHIIDYHYLGEIKTDPPKVYLKSYLKPTEKSHEHRFF